MIVPVIRSRAPSVAVQTRKIINLIWHRYKDTFFGETNRSQTMFLFKSSHTVTPTTTSYSKRVDEWTRSKKAMSERSNKREIKQRYDFMKFIWLKDDNDSSSLATDVQTQLTRCGPHFPKCTEMRGRQTQRFPCHQFDISHLLRSSYAIETKASL